MWLGGAGRNRPERHLQGGAVPGPRRRTGLQIRRLAQPVKRPYRRARDWRRGTGRSGLYRSLEGSVKVYGDQQNGTGLALAFEQTRAWAYSQPRLVPLPLFTRVRKRGVLGSSAECYAFNIALDAWFCYL